MTSSLMSYMQQENKSACNNEQKCQAIHIEEA